MGSEWVTQSMWNNGMQNPGQCDTSLAEDTINFEPEELEAALKTWL